MSLFIRYELAISLNICGHDVFKHTLLIYNLGHKTKFNICTVLLSRQNFFRSFHHVAFPITDRQID